VRAANVATKKLVDRLVGDLLQGNPIRKKHPEEIADAEKNWGKKSSVRRLSSAYKSERQV
jgi:hypothetical protein